MAAMAGSIFQAVFPNSGCSMDDRVSYLRVSSFRGLNLRGYSLDQRVCDYRFTAGVGKWRVSARAGGFRPSVDSRRSRSREFKEPEDDFDAALDLERIRSQSVRLIDAQQNMVGIIPKGEAIQMAEDAELDLVILSPDADPPVVRIMDYSKFRYEQERKKRIQQKKSVATRMSMKELKMGYNIDTHDYDVRMKAAQKFLKDGDKIKVIVNLKGRQNLFRNVAIELLRRFQNDLGELVTEESKNFTEKNIYIVLLPNKALQQKAQDQLKKKDSELENSEDSPLEVPEVSAPENSAGGLVPTSNQ